MGSRVRDDPRNPKTTRHGVWLKPKQSRHVCRTPWLLWRPAGTRWMCRECDQVWEITYLYNGVDFDKAWGRE